MPKVKQETMDMDVADDGEISEKMQVGEAVAAPVTDKGEYETLCSLVNPIAKPLASRKLAKKVYKIVKKATNQKDYIRYGLADVQKALRRNEKGLIILAGNVTPIDVYSHLPGICEEKDIPYIYTPSREHLGLAAGHKRPVIALLIKENDEYSNLYQEICSSIQSIVVDPEVL